MPGPAPQAGSYGLLWFKVWGRTLRSAGFSVILPDNDASK